MPKEKSAPTRNGERDTDVRSNEGLLKDLKSVEDQVRQGFKTKSAIDKNDTHLMKKAIMISRGILKADPVENVYHQAELPRGLSINFCGHCNYNCSYCAIVLEPHSPEYINEEMLKKTIDEIGNQPLYVQLGARGENLLHPQFFEFIEYIKDKNPETYICVNTNGAMCGKKMTEKLLASAIDQIIFSLQTIDEKIYEKIENSKHFYKVIGIIRHFAQRHRELDSDMMVSAQFLPIEENLPHKNAFKAFCEECGINMQVSIYHEWGDKFESELDTAADRYPCPYLWIYPTLTHNGNLGPCPVDWYEEMVYGSVKEDSVHDVWTGERAQEIRKMHLDSRWDELPLCKNCSVWSLLPNPFVKEDGHFRLKDPPLPR